jgi:hypothetical protein
MRLFRNLLNEHFVNFDGSSGCWRRFIAPRHRILTFDNEEIVYQLANFHQSFSAGTCMVKN